jgi:hypothetical protein
VGTIAQPLQTSAFCNGEEMSMFWEFLELLFEHEPIVWLLACVVIALIVVIRAW